MVAAAKTMTEMNAVIGGNGIVDMGEALIALGATTGLVAFTKRIGLWAKFSPAEQREIEALDEDMPSSWWHGVKDRASASLAAGRRLRWRHGDRDLAHDKTGWSVDTTDEGDLLVRTPVLDEETGTLV